MTLCRFLQPDLFYLMPTAEGPAPADSTTKQAQETSDYLVSEQKTGKIQLQMKIHIRPISVTDPTDYLQIMPSIRRLVSEVLNELGTLSEDFTLHANCSSGTPQLKGIWPILANAGLLPRCTLWQVRNPIHKGDRVTRLQTTYLEEENILDRIKHNLSDSLFGAIAGEFGHLAKISCDPWRQSSGLFLKQVFSAYHAWDLIQYDQASDLLRHALLETEKETSLGRIAPLLKKQFSVLEKLKRDGSKETKANLGDIYYNAQRCFQRYNYADTLARFRRCYEGALYWRFREEYKIEPTNLERSRNQGNVRAALAYLQAKGIGVERNDLKMHFAASILEFGFQDPQFLRLLETMVPINEGAPGRTISARELLRDLINSRNQSIVAHGMMPVNRLDAETALQLMKATLTILVDPAILEKPPLSQENLRQVISLLDPPITKSTKV